MTEMFELLFYFTHEKRNYVRKGDNEMAKIIAVANQKGGCSKTTVVANLGVGLSMKGKKLR